MEYDSKIYKEHRLVVEEIRGKVTVPELRDKFISLFQNPEYDDSMRGLCDLRKATSEMEYVEFKELADEINVEGNFGQARWAILTNDPLLTAFAQIFQERVDQEGNIRVFSSLEAAEKYVGVPLSLMSAK